MNGALTEGISLYNEGQYLLALDFLEVLDPGEEPQVLYYLGLTYARLSNWRKALGALDQAYAQEGNFLKVFQIRMVRAFVMTQLGRLEEAEKELASLMKEGIESPQVYSQYGYVLWALGRGREGIQWLNEALRRQAHNTTALNSLGYILAEEGILLDRALGLCEKAVELDPANPLYLDSLGWVYFKLGRRKEAETTLKKALELDPENPAINQHWKTIKESLK